MKAVTIQHLRVKIALICTLALGVAVALPAEEADAHGSVCVAKATVTFPGGDAKATASVTCGTSHNVTRARVEFYAKFPSQSQWTLLGTNTKECANTTTCSTNLGPVGCATGQQFNALAWGDQKQTGGTFHNLDLDQSAIKVCP